MGREGARPCPLAVSMGLPPEARPADHLGPEHHPILITCLFPECSPQTHGPSQELRKWVSDARTRGPRPVSTQVDRGGVCSGSTESLPPCCSASGPVAQGPLSPEACVTHFLPAERSPMCIPCRGLSGVAHAVCGLGFTDLPLCLGGQNRAPPPSARACHCVPCSAQRRTSRPLQGKDHAGCAEMQD